MTKDEWIRFTAKTLDAVRIMMENRDRHPHEEAIYTAVRHCIDEIPPTGKMVLSDR